MQKVEIYTDGSCRGNPGPGGWAAVIRTNIYGMQSQTQLTGFSPNTTNNRMELMAAIEGLNHIQPEATIDLYSDSKYVIDGMTKWIYNWMENGWRNCRGRGVENQDLWEELFQAAHIQHVNWIWVKGHSGVDGNELANLLARRQIAIGLKNADN